MNNKYLILLVNAWMTELNALHNIPNRIELIASYAIDTGAFLEELLLKELKCVRSFSVFVVNADEHSVENFDESTNAEKIGVEIVEAVFNSVAAKLSVILKASARMTEDLLGLQEESKKSLKATDMFQIGSMTNAAIKEIITDLVAEERVNFEKIPGYSSRSYSQSSVGQFYVE